MSTEFIFIDTLKHIFWILNSAGDVFKFKEFISSFGVHYLAVKQTEGTFIFPKQANKFSNFSGLQSKQTKQQQTNEQNFFFFFKVQE